MTTKITKPFHFPTFTSGLLVDVFDEGNRDKIIGSEETYFFPTGVSKKITRRTTTSERKQVFASKSKFHIESVRKQETYSK